MDEASLVARISAAEKAKDWRGVMDAMSRGIREGASNAGVAKYGCRALSTLINNNLDNQKRIAEAGGIPMILRMLDVHGASNAGVAEEGCGALMNLACNNVDNRKSIGEAGGIAMILKMLDVHGASNAGVARLGCGALLNLANADNQKRIGEAGGINAGVAEQRCGALRSLANNADNKRKIVAANGVSMVERMKSTWTSNAGVQKYANGALAILRSPSTLHL